MEPLDSPTFAPDQHPTGFAHRDDYVLFGLLLRHGLCQPDDFNYLALVQRREYGDQTLLNILTEVNELSEKQVANIKELVSILGTPKLRDLLPAELPAVQRLIETARESMPIHAAATEVERPGLADELAGGAPSTVKFDAVTDGEAIADLELSQTRTQVTEEEFDRIMRARKKSPIVGKVLAGHVVLDQLGKGGQGEVYLAKQLSLNRYVALKRLYLHNPAQSREFVDAFRREAQTLGRINHARIVKVFEIFEQEGQVFFTMEYLQGRNLSDLVKETGAMPADLVANLACQACSALGRTSQDGLVHRDIKPQNVLLDENGDLKIVDFGLAEVASRLGIGSQAFAGTPAYASPEQLLLEPLTAQSDQYSLGVTLYAILTGGNPRAQIKKYADLVDEVDNRQLPPPSQLNPDVPRAVDRVVMRMIERKPEDRYASYEECYKDWAKILSAPGSSRAASTVQLLGDALLQMGSEQRKRLARNGAILCTGWLLATVGTLLSEWQFRHRGLGYILDAAGTVGTWMLVFSLSCIFYIALARKGKLPMIGSYRAWLYIHIATAVPSVALLMVHSGDFLRGIMPGSEMAKPVLSILMALALIITAASGSVGLLLFRELRRQLQIQQLELRSGEKPTPRQEMLTLLSARVLSGWRLVHYPLAFFFIVLSAMHILLMVRFGK